MAATRTIVLQTEVPGPRSREVLDRLAATVASPLAITFPVVAATARGATITDLDGNTFLDFAGGVGCLNVGHSHPHVVQAAQEQLEHFSHTDFTVVPYENYATLVRAPARPGAHSRARSRPRSSTPAARRSRTPSSSPARSRAGTR